MGFFFDKTVVAHWPVVSGSSPRSTLIAANLASTVLRGLAAEASKRVVPLFQIKKGGLRPLFGFITGLILRTRSQTPPRWFWVGCTSHE
jgi:hypothetical protein